MSKQVSLSFVIAYLAWAAAVGMWIVSWILASDHLGQLALMIGLAAATASVRLWMIDSVRELQNTLRVVREIERHDSVRPMR